MFNITSKVFVDESLEWLEWIAITHLVFVQHRGNYGERTIYIPYEWTKMKQAPTQRMQHYWKTTIGMVADFPDIVGLLFLPTTPSPP